MLIGLAVPESDTDALELALLRRGHTVAWRADDLDEVMMRIAERTPDILLIGDHPAVASVTVVGACDLMGVRSCLVVTESQPLSPAAQRLGVHDVVRIGAGGIDLSVLDAPAMPTASGHTATTTVSNPRVPGATPAASGANPAVSNVNPRASGANPAADMMPASSPTRHPRTIVVWGPAGAPGRTTLAIALASELAVRGRAVALLDVDTYGGTVAPALGLLDEAPGFAAACRLAGNESLTLAELDRVAQTFDLETHTSIAVLTGIGRAHRWPELSGARVRAVIDRCRRWREVIVIDAGFNLESDEEISSDLVAPRRNAATITALRSADLVIAVGSADPIGLARLLRSYGDLLEIVETTRVQVVVNRVRSSVLGIDPRGQVRQTLERFAGIRDAVLIEDDQHAADRAVLSARPVTVAAPRSALGRGVGELADAAGFAAQPVRRWGSSLSQWGGVRRGRALAGRGGVLESD